MLGRKQSKQQIADRAAAVAKTYIVRFPDDSLHVVVNLREFARNTGLSHGHLWATLGHDRKHKGYTVLAKCTKK